MHRVLGEVEKNSFYCFAKKKRIKFRLKLKNVRKTTRSFRYDLNQVPYDYMVEVTNRFKGLDLIDRMLEELWIEVGNIVQEAVIKNIPTKKKCKKTKQLSERAYKELRKVEM